MPWRSDRIEARPAEPKRRVALTPSPALMRICGSIGFCGAAYVTVLVVAPVLGLPSDFLEAGEWGAREAAAFALALAASVVGGLLGAGLGLQFNVTNASAQRLLLLVWHFVADGQILAMVLLSMALSRQRHVATVGEAVWAFGLTAAACALLGVALFLLGQFKDDERPNAALCLVVCVPVSVAVALAQAKAFAIERNRAIVMGVVFGVAVFLVSAHMIQRDRRQAAQLQGRRG